MRALHALDGRTWPIASLLDVLLLICGLFCYLALQDGVGTGPALLFLAGLILVGISMGLTLIAGLIPSRLAAKKDPVVALRTE